MNNQLSLEYIQADEFAGRFLFLRLAFSALLEGGPQRIPLTNREMYVHPSEKRHVALLFCKGIEHLLFGKTFVAVDQNRHIAFVDDEELARLARIADEKR